MSSPGSGAKKRKPGFKLPEPGEVLNYSYLREREFRQGRDEGVKDRPVAVVLLTRHVDGFDLVHVVPLSTRVELDRVESAGIHTGLIC